MGTSIAQLPARMILATGAPRAELSWSFSPDCQSSAKVGRRRGLMRKLFITLILATFQIAGTTQSTFSMRVIATGLDAPWDILWGPDNRLWVTERIGKRVDRVSPADGTLTRAVLIDEVYPGTSWHEGLLGLALHPDVSKGVGRDYVDVAYTYDADPGAALARRLKVRRYTFNAANGTLVDPLDIITNLPAHDDHGGGRLIFGPD